MSEAFKLCPICQTRNQRQAALCVTCGATLADVAPQAPRPQPAPSEPRYDFRLGETDLAEASLSRTGRALSILLGLLLVAGAALALALLWSPGGGASDAESGAPPSPKPTRIAGPTVTRGPPSATASASPTPTVRPSDTATPAPCLRTVASGDSLIGIVLGCGHQNLDILPTVMALNAIADQALIQIGQEILVPPPSPTLDPAATASATSTAEVSSASAPGDALALLAFDPLAPTETPTLLPGLMWHIIQPDENMIVIALQYKTDAKALSDLNPEIEFLLCDFGLAYGGPECTVQLKQGQRIRVPAPTPTLTPIPTASGSETPTPLPSATFNAPIAQSPPHQAVFAPQDQVTLRWVGTGRLAPNDVYRVTLTNSESGLSHSAETRELFYIIPASWRTQDDISHDYTWQVSVLDKGRGQAEHFSGERAFSWQGAGQPAT